MSKLLRRLGQAGKASKGGHDPPLPPLEDYAASPLLSELPDECRAMVRKAGLLPAEAEQDFMVLLSCLYFELKHNPDLTAHVKALIRKHRRSTRKSPTHHHHRKAGTGAAEAAATAAVETSAADEPDGHEEMEPAQAVVGPTTTTTTTTAVARETSGGAADKTEKTEKTERAKKVEKAEKEKREKKAKRAENVENAERKEEGENQAALPSEAPLAAPKEEAMEEMEAPAVPANEAAPDNGNQKQKTKKKKKKRKKTKTKTKKAEAEAEAANGREEIEEVAAVGGATSDVAERVDSGVRTVEEEEEEEEGDESDGGAPPTKTKTKTKAKTKAKANKQQRQTAEETSHQQQTEPGEGRNQPAGSVRSGSSQQPAAAPAAAEVAPEAARPAMGIGGGEARGRARGFSFSTFFRPSPSLSAPDLAGQADSDATSRPGKKRFSASGLLRPSASPSGAHGSSAAASSSPLAQPSPPPGKKAAAKQQQQRPATAAAGGHEEDHQSHHNNGSRGDHPADATQPGFPVRGELFLLDNPAHVFSSKQRIGRGGFGDVYTGKDKTTNQVVAIKILKKPYSEHGEQICNELEILRSCRHDSIVNYLRSYLFKDRVWMVMEYCDGGSLQSLIAGVDLNEGQIANVLRKVLLGLDYLHKQNRIHRDIKADNILLNINGAVKVADLGLCAELKDGDDSHAGMVGSRYWMAPEVIKRERYNSKVDIWSLGAVAMEMAQQHPPYHGQPSLRVLFHLATKGAPPLKQPKKWSPEFQDFLAQCFIMDPDQRPSAEQLLEHPFIAKASPNSKLEQAISIVFLGDSLKMNGF